MDIEMIQKEIRKIVWEYLYNISNLRKHNYFEKRKELDSRVKYFNSRGFQILNEERDNYYVMKEEMFLEGCTRVFLVNPIIKRLLEIFGYESDWRYGTTFSNYEITNREHELGSYIEFIVSKNNTNIGFRHTKNSYKSEEFDVMSQDCEYLFCKKEIPGFEMLKTLDEVIAIDWSGISEQELWDIQKLPQDLKRTSNSISTKMFFEEYFSLEVYEIFISEAKRAIDEAKQIIGLKAVPQLLSNNMLSFKESIIKGFTEEIVSTFEYQFENDDIKMTLSDDDISAIDENFFIQNYRLALIGKENFAKCFITSEYLFRTLQQGISIDFTSVVAGYLKSVEQLLYIFYLSAFGESRKLEYWDKCNKTQCFDLNNSKYRYEPYNPEKYWKQEKYWHSIKTGEKAPTIGELTLFLRYNDILWNVSEEGKEYIYKCLDDFCSYCRNSHFHKDNIGTEDYDMVVRIKNNTYVCLYYLLGAFNLLDKRTSGESQLGIIDYSFEQFYKEVWEKRRKLFWVEMPDGYKGLVYYLCQDYPAEFDGTGLINNKQLNFVKIPKMTKETAYGSEIEALIEDNEFLSQNITKISREAMPNSCEAIMPKKKRV